MSILNRVGKAYKSSLKAKVTLCIPSQDQCAIGFAFDLAGLCGYTATNFPNVEIGLLQGRGSILPGLRHNLASRALRTPATHILWLDSDMRFPKDGLVRLLAHNKPIVGASYVTRRDPFHQVAAKYPPMQPIVVKQGDTGLVPVDYNGFGFLLTATDVFRKLTKPYFNFGYSTKDDDFIGEDIYFALKAKQAGFENLVDVGLTQEVGHCGEFVFENAHLPTPPEA